MNSPARKLGEYKNIKFIGGQITSRIEANIAKEDTVLGAVKVIPPKAISSGRIQHEELYDLEYKTEFNEEKLTQEGDIVVKLSTPYDAAYITEKDVGLLITSFCIIVRLKNKDILPKYLLAYFNSEIYREQVKSLMTGAVVPMLTMGKIKEVELKEFTIHEQEQIAIFFENICKREILMKQIVELEKEKLNAVLGGLE